MTVNYKKFFETFSRSGTISASDIVRQINRYLAMVRVRTIDARRALKNKQVVRVDERFRLEAWTDR